MSAFSCELWPNGEYSSVRSELHSSQRFTRSSESYPLMLDRTRGRPPQLNPLASRVHAPIPMQRGPRETRKRENVAAIDLFPAQRSTGATLLSINFLSEYQSIAFVNKMSGRALCAKVQQSVLLPLETVTLRRTHYLVDISTISTIRERQSMIKILKHIG